MIRANIAKSKEAKKLKKNVVKKSMAFVMGCDLNSNPDSAAYDILMSKKIFEKDSTWIKPTEVSEEALGHYKYIENHFKHLKEKGKLDSLLNKLESAYNRCTYRHGQHTSRASTRYGPGVQQMQDFVIYNHEKLQVLSLLEIPSERQLAPSAVKHPTTEGNLVSILPNIVYPSDHIRIEVEM